ncbi:sensor histidine kinase [Rhodomicrobium sp.]|uniref:sensor histidine kinase n=1 Tax=Rhodomicrobium sp. TaxID=2720632 RepID=UPI0039E5C59F
MGIGLTIPNASGAALLSLAPLGGAVFLHFSASLTEKGVRWVRWAYGIGSASALAALTKGTGQFIALPDDGYTFRYAEGGLLAASVTVALAVVGHCLLIAAWRGSEATGRREIAFVFLSSALGFASVTSLGLPLFGVNVYPWTLLLLPVYIAVLSYAVLRYRLMGVNRWAVRVVCWGLLAGLAGLVSAVSAGFAAQQAGAPFGWIALALIAGLTLAEPMLKLADRIVFPGGAVTAADLADWRRELVEAANDAELDRKAEDLLKRRLGLPADADSTELDHAPPGPRRAAEMMAEVLVQAKENLAHRRAVSERKRLAELGALAATVAHDLRNPMNIISMAVADADPGTRSEVKAQLVRMDALVRDLLDYAKPWKVEASSVDLASVVWELDASAETAFPPKFTVRADPARLRQALANLLDNAKAAGGKVLVAAETSGGGVAIHVCDDGLGIPQTIRASLFQPFVSGNSGGTGLGLAIVAKVMSAHGGSVTLGERAGWSTCFTLRFPS